MENINITKMREIFELHFKDNTRKQPLTFTP